MDGLKVRWSSWAEIYRAVPKRVRNCHSKNAGVKQMQPGESCVPLYDGNFSAVTVDPGIHPRLRRVLKVVT